jgi:hypothetical protein
MRILILLSVAVVGARAQSYAIRMAPPTETGKTYSVTTVGYKVEKVSVGNQVVKDADYRVNFEGRALVVEVDSRSRPIKIVFTVDKFTKTEAGVTMPLLESGTQVIADGKQVKPIYLKDGSIEESVRDAFDLVYSAHKPDDVTDDDVFGTKELKSIGDKWPINRSFALQSFQGSGIVIPADRLNGTVLFEGVGKIGNVDCVSLRSEMTASSFALSSLPEGFVGGSSNMTAVLRGCFPVESRGLQGREGAEVTVEIHGSLGDKKIDASTSKKRDVVWVLVER